MNPGTIFEEEKAFPIDIIENRLNERYPSIKKIIFKKLKTGVIDINDIGVP
jgi:hypothetical protein